MSPLKPNFPDIPEAERTPVIDALLELLKWQSDRIELTRRRDPETKARDTQTKI